jgi:hypothetical protein
MLHLLSFVLLLVGVLCDNVYITGNARGMPFHSHALSLHAGSLMCAAGCMEVEHRYDIPMKIIPKDKDCEGAALDKDDLQRREIRKGIRYTGEYNGWRCVIEEDPSCPSEYEYFAFMAYGCEKRNGTKYWVTHTYEALHKMLVEFKK